MRRRGTRTAVVVLAAILAACSSAGPTATQAEVTTLDLTSGSFEDGGSIPSRHTCDGADVSPPLAWSGVPDGVESFAIVVDDPDARGFVHWVLTGIPGEARELAEGQGDRIGTPGRNDFGRSGWGGPCPPAEHRYVFTLYALPGPLSGATDADAVRARASESAVAQATLTGIYARR
jgi:Raf kinase inhibitor-like YbhB/YbcL family protein